MYRYIYNIYMCVLYIHLGWPLRVMIGDPFCNSRFPSSVDAGSAITSRQPRHIGVRIRDVNLKRWDLVGFFDDRFVDIKMWFSPCFFP